MKMIFIGATHEVTGSCTYLEVCGKRILVDFGMEQGRDTYENVKIPTNIISNITLILFLSKIIILNSIPFLLNLKLHIVMDVFNFFKLKTPLIYFILLYI